MTLKCIGFGIIAFTVIFGSKLESHFITGVWMFSLFFFIWAEVFLKRYEMEKMPSYSELPLYDSDWKKLAGICFKITLYIIVIYCIEKISAYLGAIMFRNLLVLFIGIVWGADITRVWCKFR